MPSAPPIVNVTFTRLFAAYVVVSTRRDIATSSAAPPRVAFFGRSDMTSVPSHVYS